MLITLRKTSILNIFLWGIGILSLALAGCSQPSSGTLKPPYPIQDDATVKLAEAASVTSHSLIQMARVESAASPVGRRAVTMPDIPGMSQLVSVDWSGPLEPLVEKIASMSGYHLRVLGRAPAIPVLVTVSAVDKQLSLILRDIDYQASKKARIFVYPSSNPKRRVIELRYA